MIDDIKVFWTDKNNKTTDITKLCGGMSWSSNKSRHTMEFKTSLPDIADRYIEHYKIEASDKIQLIYTDYTGKEKAKYYFVVVDVERNKGTRSIVCKDLNYYIEKSEIIMQFKKVSGKKAIEMIGAELGIEVVCCNLPVKIDEIYINSAEDIIDDILDKQKKSNGKKYWYEMDGKKLKVYQISDEPVKLMYKPAINVNEIDVCQWHSDMSYSHSMSNLYDSVKAVIKSSTDGNLPALEYTITDNDHVRKYGKIQKIVTLTADDKDEVVKIAKNELDSNNDLTREMGFGTFGCIDAKVNVCAIVNDKYTGIDNLLRITEAVHNYEEGKYTMNLKFEFIKEYAASNITTSKVQRESIEKKSKDSKASDRASAVIKTARKLKGKIRYVWGGNNPNSGMDCSHFVCWAFRNCGYSNMLKSKGYGTAATIYSWSKHVSASNRQPGDIVFFNNGKYNHIGIYTGNGKMIHCNGSTNGVAENSVSSGGHLVGYGRVW